MRELRSSVIMGKHIIALVDPETVHGGLSIADIESHLIESDAAYAGWGFDNDYPKGRELFQAIFHNPPIEWNRLGLFQDVMRTQIAQRILASAAAIASAKE